MRQSRWSTACAVALAAAMIVTTAGCTRRQVIPGVVAGAGAAMVTSGAIYRATLDTDEPFGETGGEIAATTILLFGGFGLLVTGIVLSITFAHCESNDDCWGSDACELRSHTCISGAAARALTGPRLDPDAESDDSSATPADDTPADDGDEPVEEEEEEEEEEERRPYPY